MTEDRFRTGPSPKEPFRNIAVGESFFIPVSEDDFEREAARARSRAYYFSEKLSTEQGEKVIFSVRSMKTPQPGVLVRRVS